MVSVATRLADGRTQVFGSLLAMVFLVNMARVIYAPLLEPFRTTFGASEAAVGLLATLVWIGSASLRLPTGYVLTKVPRHWVVLVAGGVLTVSSAFAATAQTLSMLYIGALTMGVASGVYFVSANPLVSELFPARVGRVIGIHGTSSQVAAVSAPLLVVAYFAVPWPIAAWRAVFLTISVAALLSTVTLFVTARRTTLPEAGGQDRRLWTALRDQWPIIVTGVAIVSTVGLVWNGVFNFYVTFLVETRGFSQGRAQTYLTVLFAAGVPAFFITGWIVDRVRILPVVFSVIGSFAIGLVALTRIEGALGLLVMSVVLGYIIHSLFPAIDTYMLASLPDESRGSAYALFSGTMMPIQATGSVILGTLVGRGIGFHRSFLLFAAAILVALAVMVVLDVAGKLPTAGPPGARHEPRE